jgi:hypothetical protein
LAAVKSNTRVQLFVDGKHAARIDSRPEFNSGSPWVLGQKGKFDTSAADAGFARIRLSKVVRYAGPFKPQVDYGSDRDTVLFR